MEKSIKLGVIGLGKRGSSLLRTILNGIPAFKVTFVCDGYEDKAKASAEKVKQSCGEEIGGLYFFSF